MKNSPTHVRMIWLSVGQFGTKRGTDKGDGREGGDSGELFEEECAGGEKGRVQVKTEWVQVQKRQKNQIPKRNSSQSKTNDDGKLCSSSLGHKPAEVDRNNAIKIYKNHLKFNCHWESQPLILIIELLLIKSPYIINMICLLYSLRDYSTSYEQSHQNARLGLYCTSHQQSSWKWDLLTTTHRLLQREVDVAVCGRVQKCIQNVLPCPHHPLPSLQTQKIKGKVPPSLFSPLSEIKHFLKGFIKSLLFAGGYSMLIRRTICFVTKYYRYNESTPIVTKLPQSQPPLRVQSPSFSSPSPGSLKLLCTLWTNRWRWSTWWLGGGVCLWTCRTRSAGWTESRWQWSVSPSWTTPTSTERATAKA